MKQVSEDGHYLPEVASDGPRRRAQQRLEARTPVGALVPDVFDRLLKQSRGGRGEGRGERQIMTWRRRYEHSSSSEDLTMNYLRNESKKSKELKNRKKKGLEETEKMLNK